MEHCAIDLGGRKSQVCIRDAGGQVVHESRWDTLLLPQYLRALPRKCRVILETSAEAFRVAEAAREAGHEVRVVPATLVATLGVGARRTKTDMRDTRVLSEVSSRIDLPSVHVPSARSREWKSICGMHSAVVSARTKLINNLRGWLRGQGVRVSSGKASTFAERMRKLSLPPYLEGQLQMIETLTEQIALSERRLEKLAEANDLCRRLMTVPGVGPQVALRFVAAIDEVGRFESAHKVAAYLGLTPGESSSAERQQRLSITKAGSTSVRWVLVQAAWSLRGRCRSAGAKPLQLWAAEIEHRRGKRIATIALARKLAGILYALWRDGTTFEPHRL